MYEYGEDPTSEQFDINECKKSAESGYAVAQSYLGDCYAHGEGVVPDHDEACRWYTLSAEQNDAHAQYMLGLCYCYGAGRDRKKGLEWFKKAAENGDPDAQQDWSQ